MNIVSLPSIRSRIELIASAALLLLTATTASAAQSPFSGSAIQLPSVIEAEQYDLGGQGVAYHDTSPGNAFGTYRNDDMDVGPIPGGGYHLGNLASGEWAEYTVDVPRSQPYEVRLRLASDYPGPTTFHLELDGVAVTSSQSVSHTGGWQSYIVKTIPNVFLTAGNNKVLRVSFDTGAWNLDSLEFRGQVPWASAPATVPGRIQAEDFDRGGEGLAYHDTTIGNVFGTYRTDDMDVGPIPGGGHHVGYVTTGEWVEYTVDVQQTQGYELLVRAASADPRTVQYQVELDGQNLTGTRTLPETAGWQAYTTRIIPVGTISAGNGKVLRVAFDLNSMNLDWIELRGTGCTPPTITSHPTSRTVPADDQGFQVVLAAAASGTPALSYQWFLNGSPVPGATSSSSLDLGPVHFDETGLYFVRATNACGFSDSNQAEVLQTCDPGELTRTLTNAFLGKHRVCPWQEPGQNGGYNPNFPSSMGGGSYNKPVLAAAVAAVVDPSLPGPGGAGSTVRDWWRVYLQGELGMRGADWAFGGREPFSHVYHHNNLAAVMAINYEARQRGWSDVRDLARQWLRANFALMASAATDKPRAFHDRAVESPFVDNYNGPWVATAGMRTLWSHWGLSSRNILFARAVGLSGTGPGNPLFNEFEYQAPLREFLELHDNNWNHATEGDVYGLTPSEKSALAGIKSSSQLPSGFFHWIAGIKTVVPYHIVGWPGARVSLMESNRHGSTAPTYGIAYFGATGEAHFLYPWNRKQGRKCLNGRSGVASIDPGLTWIEVSNGPAPTSGNCAGVHPEETVRIDGLPGGTPRYHIALPPYKSNW